MPYCSRCGSELPAHPPVRCPACGAQHWRNASPAANALVVHDGKLLLVRRAHDPWRGRWCAPGGFCDPLEHPIATVERETTEEAGLAIEVTGYLGTWISYYAEDDVAGTGAADDALIAVAYYHARLAGEAAGRLDPAEVSELAWFAPDALPDAVAPPGAFPLVLAAWLAALGRGETVTPLRDRPRR